jgi:hypothetical protein
MASGWSRRRAESPPAAGRGEHVTANAVPLGTTEELPVLQRLTVRDGHLGEAPEVDVDAMQNLGNAAVALM